MKRILLIIIIFLSITSSAQTPLAIVNYFKEKKIEKIVACADFPFKINFGPSADDANIKDSNTLRKRLAYFYKNGLFDGMKGGKIIKNNGLEYSIEVHSYNKEGEMESESDYIFLFKKTTKGYKLCSIDLAG